MIDSNSKPGGAVGVVERLYHQILDLIENQRLTEGSRLPAELELVREFSVSRPAVREVLSRLRENGIITSRKGSGSYLQRRPGASGPAAGLGFAPIESLGQFRRCFEFRIGLEGESAYCAAKYRAKKTIDSLNAAYEHHSTVVSGRVAGVDADFSFHLAVARCADNEYFETLLLAMREPIEVAISLGRTFALSRANAHSQLVQTEHKTIVEAIVQGDPDEARQAMRDHLQKSYHRFLEGPNR